MATVEKPDTTPPPQAETESQPFPRHFRGGEAGSRWKFDVTAYHKMGEAGIFDEDDRVELLDGDILILSPIGPPHFGCTAYLTHTLKDLVGANALILNDAPVRLNDRSEPEPDIVLLRPRPDFYRNGIPGPDDVLLLVEVMDSSADYDRGKKLGLYARAGIRGVWLVDINGELIEAHRRPVGEVYTENRIVPRGQSLAPEAFPEAVVAVNGVLG
jgi:Uma2 family endonuclease